MAALSDEISSLCEAWGGGPRRRRGGGAPPSSSFAQASADATSPLLRNREDLTA